ncbi:MAG: bifunctional 3-hydroxydecanoyl-ACP dehydratase/trans-2-decenoyl-ACP isomerase [Candidatus Kapabacteria bacterium]|nr:bifunctional 3-hydroxydecanoyl-ACP dehydratase/trans-2-decenoyl-ACP isomerase [Ignavibacteriota bacterium]MCW5884146.1 bifunctional 3-hydroxydecanoyl-ACP dehydratase/trans-2-decenoyl-ACP isomerase [Candidatus Kapabacteria bacterium]
MQRKNSYNYDDLILAGTGELFGPECGKLPLPNMLMMDRITSIENTGGMYGKGCVVAELDIKPDLWFFDCHFRGDSVMPGSLGLDALLQLTGFYLVWAEYKGKGRALGCDKLKFFGQVLPTHKKVTYIVDIKRIINLKLTMIIADGRVLVDDKEIYTCENMRVGLFTNDEIVM